MDQSQFNLKSAGRFDLAGINHGDEYSAKTGTDKASLYELANAKPDSIAAMTENMSANAPTQDSAIAYKELQAMIPNSKGANRDAIVTQMERLNEVIKCKPT